MSSLEAAITLQIASLNNYKGFQQNYKIFMPARKRKS